MTNLTRLGVVIDVQLSGSTRRGLLVVGNRLSVPVAYADDAEIVEIEAMDGGVLTTNSPYTVICLVAGKYVRYVVSGGVVTIPPAPKGEK